MSYVTEPSQLGCDTVVNSIKSIESINKGMHMFIFSKDLQLYVFGFKAMQWQCRLEYLCHTFLLMLTSVCFV